MYSVSPSVKDLRVNAQSGVSESIKDGKLVISETCWNGVQREPKSVEVRHLIGARKERTGVVDTADVVANSSTAHDVIGYPALRAFRIAKVRIYRQI